MLEKDCIKIKFKYTDDYGHKTRLKKIISSNVLEDISGLDILVDEFKIFLLSCGFTQDGVDSRIQG